MSLGATSTGIFPAAGGKMPQGFGRNLGSGTSSDGLTESSPHSLNEEDDGCTEVSVMAKEVNMFEREITLIKWFETENCEEMCPVALRPDLGLPVQELIKDKLIIRSSQLATHVLVMGSPSMMLEPVRCPYENTGCESFRAHAPQHVKEHLEWKHELYNVQLNLVCPCPAACSIVDGEPQECEVVEYDPRSGVMAHHLTTHHKNYHNKMRLALCYRPYPGDPEGDSIEGRIWDDPEEKPDLDYLKHLKLDKKFPAWTRKKRHLFPSQRIAEKVTIQTIVQNKKLAYACDIPACAGKIFNWREIGWHTLKMGHPDVLGGYGQTQWFERCDACGTTMHWSHCKMRLHIQAMHPELLGEPKHFVQQALEERERLQAQIQKICIGQAIADTAAPGNESDGTKAHMLYQYICPVTTCKKRFDESVYAKWHIIVDHGMQWDVAGNESPEAK